jgi:predicted membrane protein
VTNEEIYKYADKKLAKAQNRYYLRYSPPLVFSIIGWALMTYPLSASESNIVVGSIIVFGIIAFSIIIVLWNNLLKAWFNKRREYIANLVRKDERNRCMTKMERYESEGSK